jgi:hypothetical protein
LAVPLPAFVFKVPNQLLLLGIHRNDGAVPAARPVAPAG